jgi:hypothetical protein
MLREVVPVQGKNRATTKNSVGKSKVILCLRKFYDKYSDLCALKG